MTREEIACQLQRVQPYGWQTVNSVIVALTTNALPFRYETDEFEQRRGEIAQAIMNWYDAGCQHEDIPALAATIEPLLQR